MKKVVIVGSASLQKDITLWKILWENEGFCVSAYPKKISRVNFSKIYPGVHKHFFKSITETDILFVMNEDKKGIVGYLGAESFAEMCFAVAQNILHKKKIEVILLKMPDKHVPSYDEIRLWLKLGWIKLYRKAQ